MAIRKSNVLLPDVFKTNKNTKFLNATVDQLISEPNLERVNSFIGRKFSPNFTVGDSYVQEIDADRQNYQLEPAVVYRNSAKRIENLAGYADFVNVLRYNNVDVENHSDLFVQEYYNYSGFVDFDKLVNYGEYFWLPGGPDSVQVFNNTVDTEKEYTVSRDTLAGETYYTLDGGTNRNPTIILARGGSYTFEVNQLGTPFFIQSEPGNTGISSHATNISTREVFGVENNGDDVGTITFNVPESDAQNLYVNATKTADVDYATTLRYPDLHNVPLSVVQANGGIDQATAFAGKKLVFVNTTNDETAWDQGALFDAHGFDSATANGEDGSWDTTTRLSVDVRYDIYEIEVNNIGGVDTVQLRRDADWPNLTKVKIKQGAQYGNREFYKGATGYPELIAPYTAGLDRLYYQDATNNTQFGTILIVDQDTVPAIDVAEDIIGRKNYTSNNGVKFTNGLKVQFNSDVTPGTYADKEFYVEGVGKPDGISLTAVEDLLTPETYTVSSSDGFDTTSYDTGGWDGTLNSPTKQDYIVINRASPDLNAWTRTNRWFHKEVIEATATYNDFTPVIDDTARAKRPIIEFNAGLELYNMGNKAIAPVTVVDTAETDALSNVNGKAGYFADVIDLQQDNTIIFTKDLDEDVRKTIYRVDFIDQDDDNTTNEIINLVAIGTVESGNTVLSTLGSTNQGKQFWLEGTTWKNAQQKTSINQDPLFEISDPDHVSFSDSTKYPSSNFKGNKLFSYKRNNNASPDSVLGFGLTYQNFSQIGDIVFENNYDKDTFQYTKESGNVNVIVRSGHAHVFDADGNRTLVNGWTKTVENSIQHQIVSYTVSNELYSFEIGAPVDTNTVRQSLQVFVNSKFIDPSKYTHSVQYDREYVIFNDKLTVDDIVTIKFFSKKRATNGYYEIPDNLQNNASNDSFEDLTLGQIRNHTVELSRQIKELVGIAPGESNLRDLNYAAYPGNILQHSAGMTVPMHLLTNTDYNLIDSINFVKQEYTKFKNRFLDNIDKLDLDLTDPKKCVDDILTHMAGQKTSAFPFYYSDMVPWGTQKTTLTYTVDDANEREFELTSQFDLTSVGNKAILVYKNTSLLIEGQDYTFDTDEAKIVLTTGYTLSVNDVITIEEYQNTNGSFVPPTPTKLGLFKKSYPQKYTDTSYQTSKTVVRGHDGSIFVGYDDIRDDVLLEFEKRVYNNIKTQYNENLLDFADVVPGFFRSTLDNFAESNNIIRSYYGEWALRNRVTTGTISHDGNDPFTWNYSSTTNIINGERIPGYWRAVYKWFYDTDTPNTTPWEMLGEFSKPAWWDGRYGEAPYTSGNTVLWEDLRDGKLYNSATGTEYTVKSNRKRPNLMDIIPVNEQGQLRSPNEFLVNNAFENTTQDLFAFSDHGPAETAWRRSSEWPYVLQILGATLAPAKYGTLLFDTNLFESNTAFDQILWKNKNYRPGVVDFKMHTTTSGSSVNRVEGYNQFIAEYAKFNGYNVDDINTKINNLQLNLCYAMAGFTDKQYLKVVAEAVSPSSVSENIFIPDEDLSIFTKKSSPLERVVYSGVQIIARENGYEIQGYDVENPFFKIVPSATGTEPNRVIVGESVYFEYTDYENRIVNIPYGTRITTAQQVFDFLVSYQRYLLSRGFIFDSTSGNGDKVDFVSAGKEFAFWTDQQWEAGSVIVISPFHSTLKLNRAYTTIDDLVSKGAIKDANNAIVKPKNINVSRVDNAVEINVDTTETQLYSAKLDPIQYEHVLVFNNTTIFNDVIYQPELGNRHQRFKLIGQKSGDWNGTLHAPGFILNDDVIDIWLSYTDYKKGDFVSHQGTTYVAKIDHDGKQVFDFEDWIIADNISTGMLKNITNKASEFKNFFETDVLNLEDGVDKLGKGTIGFNNKDYLQGLGLDDISQVKFYQGSLKNKGTSSAIDKLINANLTNLDQDIDFYEEYAFRVGEYGSIDSNQLVETIIPENKANNNPIVVHYHKAGDLTDTSKLELGHYHVQEKDLYKVPNNYNTKLFANRDSLSSSLNDLTTAGYARLDDVDFTVFDISDIVDLDQAQLGKGKKIWVGRNKTTWDMLRVDETNNQVISVESTQNGFLIYTTQRNHGLVAGDYALVKDDTRIGGVLQVHSTDRPNRFAVSVSDIEAAITGVNLQLYKFSSVRFKQPSALSTFTPLSGWDTQELVWVDSNANNKWEVLQNIKPWATQGIKTASGLTASDKHGTSVAINATATYAVIGAPELGTGRITPYVRSSDTGPLTEGNNRTIKTIGNSVDSFGKSVAIAGDYVAVGAPDTESATGAVFMYYIDSSGQLNRRPALRPSDLSAGDNFGHKVAISGDGKMLFATAINSNKVYSFGFVSVPTANQITDTITGDGSTQTFTLDYTPANIQSINVEDGNGFVYLPNKDFTLSGDDITFTTAPADDLSVVVRQQDYWIEMSNFAGSDTMPGDKFGSSIDVDYYGRTLVVGSPDASVASGESSTAFAQAGEAYVFSQAVQKFIGDGSTKEFTTEQELQEKIYVYVDGVLQIETDNDDIPTDNDGSSDGFYTRSGNTVKLKYNPVNGANIDVYTGTYIETQKLDQNITGETVTEGEQFGKSVGVDYAGSVIAVGAPGEDETNPNTGSVFVFMNAALNYGEVESAGTYSVTSLDTIYVDDRKVQISQASNDPSDLAADINLAKIPGVSANSNSSGNLVITSTNTKNLEKLRVTVGNGVSGRIIEPFKFTQKINHPNALENENFGETIAFNKELDGTRGMVVASDRASTLLPVGFDIEDNSNSPQYLSATTLFDTGGTTFTDKVTQSGAAYQFELLNANNESVSDSAKMVFGQQLRSTNIQALDQFGASVAYSANRIIVGAPNDTTTSGTQTLTSSGSSYEFNNDKKQSNWQALRSQGDKVDTDLINRVALYNKKDGQIVLFLDSIDSAKGKIAGRAKAELDFISAEDPAVYDNNAWTYKWSHRLWWDTSAVHYLDYEQGSLDFRKNQWNQTFPGSSIDVYEWIESDVQPSEYTGEGTPKDFVNFNTAEVYVPSANSVRTRYYFWVKGRTSIPAIAEFRNLSADSVTRLINDPKAQGVPFVGFLEDHAVALYNCKEFFADEDVVLSVNFDATRNDGILHSEFELFGRGNTDQDIPGRLYTKLTDSLAGSDSKGNIVPNPFLSEVEKYGVLTRPRQSLFVNRSAALKVMTQYCNSVFLTQPFSREQSLAKLLSSPAMPTSTSGEYDEKVDSIVERDFLNTAILATGYKVLVEQDENNNNYWAIYTLQSDKSWLLSKIQGYNTQDYWSYATYYKTGYDATTVPVYQVEKETDLLTLTQATEGQVAKVTDNDEGNFSLFAKTSTGWDEVVIENGTIQFNNSLFEFSTPNAKFETTGFDNGAFDFEAYDKVPQDEIRQIISALKDDIFVDVYKKHMNELFFRLMDYSASESNYSQDWMFKTSFLTVSHKIRSLEQYSTFKFDNTTFIEDFISEIKPYKTKIREYVSKYDKVDQFDGDTTDFDLHAFYDSDLGYFRKPSGDVAGDETLQSQGLNKPWSENYAYKVDSINLQAGGSGYLVDPTVTISAPQLTGGVTATATAKTNGDAIISITVTNKGSGYTQEPTITITGSGTGAKASPRITNNAVRSFDTTLKFDRITYSSSIKDWAKNTAYTTGDIVAYQDTTEKTQEVYEVKQNFTSGATFSTEDTSGNVVLTVYADENFKNTADRIAAYYYPTSGMIGDDLELLQLGTGYLGNKVTGPGFDQNPGFDSGNFDIVAFDNFEIDGDGLQVLAGVDTNITSSFTDTQLGLRPEDIVIDGSKFVDEYNSHAPEELIPGRVYDTLDMEVYTNASNDHEKDGNGFDIKYISYAETGGSKRDFVYEEGNGDFDFFVVYKNSTRIYDFTVNFEKKTIVLSNPILNTDILHIYAYGSTLEAPSGVFTFTGDGSTTTYVLGIAGSSVEQTQAFVDGVEVIPTTQTQDDRHVVIFSDAPQNGAHIHITTSSQADTRNAETGVFVDDITLTAGTTDYTLPNKVEYARPFSANTIVEINNHRLRPANQKYHTGDGSTTQFNIATTAGESTISSVGDIEVTVIRQSNNRAENLVRTIDFEASAGDSFITINTAPADGDTVIISNKVDAEYTIGADGLSIGLTSSVSFSTSDVLRVTRFGNHDPLRIQTKVFVGTGTNGAFETDRNELKTNHFWITLDGVRQHPGDFRLDEANNGIIFSDAIRTSLTASSEIIVSHFTENTIQPTIGFRIFQDMNGNVDYRRLSKEHTTTVTQDVTPRDTKIYVEDASKLAYAEPSGAQPGVVFIGGERITYWEVSLEDNYITSLRRGTDGTATIQQIKKGFLAVDGSDSQKLPQTNTGTNTWYNLGTGSAADGKGLQASDTANAKFLREGPAQVPNYRLELQDKDYMVADYVDDDYVETLI